MLPGIFLCHWAKPPRCQHVPWRGLRPAWSFQHSGIMLNQAFHQGKQILVPRYENNCPASFFCQRSSLRKYIFFPYPVSVFFLCQPQKRELVFSIDPHSQIGVPPFLPSYFFQICLDYSRPCCCSTEIFCSCASFSLLSFRLRRLSLFCFRHKRKSRHTAGCRLEKAETLLKREV